MGWLLFAPALPSAVSPSITDHLFVSPSPHRLGGHLEDQHVLPRPARMLGVPKDVPASRENIPSTRRSLQLSRPPAQQLHSQCSSSVAIMSDDEDGAPTCRNQADMDSTRSEKMPVEEVGRGQSGDRFGKLDVQGIACLLQRRIALSEGKLIHEHIDRSGLAGDIFLSNLLITMYGRHGAVVDARLVFDNMSTRDVVSWNSMIAAYSQQGYFNETLQLFHLMQHEGVDANGFTFVSVLNACGSLANLAEGKVIHKRIFESAFDSNVFVVTALINMYGKCGYLEDAFSVFDKMSQHDVVAWTAIITAYSQRGFAKEALQLFEQMQQQGVKPNKITFVSILSACVHPASLALGKMIHSLVLDDGLQSDIIVGTALVNMYSKCGVLEDARTVFDEMCQHNVVSWTTMIGAYTEHGRGEEALQLFKKMQQEDVQANKVTFLHLLQACESLTDLAESRKIHASIISFGHEFDPAVGTAIINMYRRYRALEDARSTFAKMHNCNVFTWNSVIAAHAEQDYSEEVLHLFRSMEQEGVRPDDTTFRGVLSACVSLAALDEGRTVHACIVNCGFDVDVVVGTALIEMYGSCGLIEEACWVFDKLAVCDVVSWNAIIGVYFQTGHDKDAFKLYQQMQLEGIEPNEATFVNVLGVCANLTARAYGESIHASIIDSEFVSSAPVGNALIHMYGKCGFLEGAHLVFNRMHDADVISWNTLMSVYNQQGHAKNAIQLFRQMQEECIIPNEVTFVSLLSACSHAGMMVEAQAFFLSMTQDYGITPIAEHCRCMIDLLGRAGQLDDAEDFIWKSQLQSDTLAWMTLLSACKIHGDVEKAVHTAEHVMALDPQNSMVYVILSDTYAADGRSDDVQRVLQCMIDRGVKKA